MLFQTVVWKLQENTATVTDWNNLDDKIKEFPNIYIFKNRLEQKTFQPPLYYYHGDRKINIIHTRIRNMCSSLNADLFRVNLKQMQLVVVAILVKIVFTIFLNFLSTTNLDYCFSHN